jgi:hypothetical protein
VQGINFEIGGKEKSKKQIKKELKFISGKRRDPVSCS